MFELYTDILTLMLQSDKVNYHHDYRRYLTMARVSGDIQKNYINTHEVVVLSWT